jgi:hypothetical protein
MSDERLQQILSSCRRRLLLVALVRYLAISWAVTAMFLAGVAFAWPSDLIVFYQRAAVALLGGLVGAALVAWMHAPSTRRTAIELDRRLTLDDSFVAALDALRASLPVASLVVRYAVNRYGSAKPRDVFPVNAGVPIVVMMAAVVAALAIGAWRRPSVQLPRAGGLVVDGGSAGPVARASEMASEARPEGRASVPESVVGRPDLSAAARAKDQASFGETSAADRPRESGAEPSSVSLNGSRAGASSAAPAKPDIGRSATDIGRGVGATAIGIPNARGQSGGVREGSLLDEARPSDSARHASGTGVNDRVRTVIPAPSAARAAWSNTDVPPGLRAYVRDYFRAVERQAERP